MAALSAMIVLTNAVLSIVKIPAAEPVRFASRVPATSVPPAAAVPILLSSAPLFSVLIFHRYQFGTSVDVAPYKKKTLGSWQSVVDRQ